MEEFRLSPAGLGLSRQISPKSVDLIPRRTPISSDAFWWAWRVWEGTCKPEWAYRPLLRDQRAVSLRTGCAKLPPRALPPEPLRGVASFDRPGRTSACWQLTLEEATASAAEGLVPHSGDEATVIRAIRVSWVIIAWLMITLKKPMCYHTMRIYTTAHACWTQLHCFLEELLEARNERKGSTELMQSIW